MKGIAFHADEKEGCSKLPLQRSPDVPVQLTVLAQNAPSQSRLHEPASPAGKLARAKTGPLLFGGTGRFAVLCYTK